MNHDSYPDEYLRDILTAVKTVAVKKMRIMKKKKSTVAIYVEEAGGDQMTAAIFWDRGKYRYEPLGSSME